MVVDDPAAGGGADQTGKTGGSDVPAGSGLTKENIVEMISTSVKAGMDTINQSLDATITGAAKRHFDKMIVSKEYKASMTETVTEAIKAAAKPPEAKPTEIQELKQSLNAVDGALKVETKKREDVETSLVEEKRMTAIGDMLKGRNIDPDKTVDLRTLLANGHLSGLSKGQPDGMNTKPTVVDGQLVYTTSDGLSKPAETVVADYLKTNSHWLTRFTAAGGGTPGSTPNAAPLDDGFTVDPSTKGSKAMAEAREKNPEAAQKALEDHVAKSAKKIPGWT